MNYTFERAEKPNDWPVNGFEADLDNIMQAYDDFIKNPGYRTREILISLYSNYDLNEIGGLGKYRVTEYEVSLINTLYLGAMYHQIPSLLCYLYEFVGRRARLQKMLCYMTADCDAKREPINIEVYDTGLVLSLKLYYFAYQAFVIEKDKGFVDKIIDVVRDMKSGLEREKDSDEALFEVARQYALMLNDLSFFQGNKIEGIWKFDRNDLHKLFELEAELIRDSGQVISKRPLLGVLMTQISNYILKSRNEYNDEWICKYLPLDVAESSCLNHEIWMRVISELNDEREGRVIETLFDNQDWIEVPWVGKIDFTPKRRYYVSSFSKSENNDKLKDKYGEIVLGYKNDRIGELISPLFMKKYRDGVGKLTKEPTLSLVMAFDVIYDENEAKDELNFLFHIIDLFDADATDKHGFLETIIQYWLLSVKEAKWVYEKERRYVLFLYDEYEYFEMEIDDGWLKEKTSLFILPDFVLGKHPKKSTVRTFVDNKRECLSQRSYYYCDDCFNRDFDETIALQHTGVCPICGSSSFHKVKVGRNVEE